MPKTTCQSDFHCFIAELLHEQGVSAAPDVTYQLAHFSHSFITNLRSDAHDLTTGNEGVTPEHIQLAHDLRSFTKSRIQRQDIYKFASCVNQKQFPNIEPHQGLSLPHEQHCLLANNYQYVKFEEETVAGKPADRKRRGGDLEEAENGAAAKRGVVKKKSAKRVQLDIDALEAEIMAELEGPSESTEPATREPPPVQERTKEDDEDDHTSQEEQEKEMYKTEKTKSSEEDEGHTASNGTKLRAAQHTQRLTPETRTIVSMKGNN